jgi:hypothetical protein
VREFKKWFDEVWVSFVCSYDQAKGHETLRLTIIWLMKHKALSIEHVKKNNVVRRLQAAEQFFESTYTNW